MPPKRKKKIVGVNINEISTAEMTREQVEALAMKLVVELQHEREERNLIQTKRDKLRLFWNVSLQELNEAKAIVRKRVNEREKEAKVTQDDVKNFECKIKFVDYAHEKDVKIQKEEAQLIEEQAQREHNDREAKLLQVKQELKWKIIKKEELGKEQIRAYELVVNEEIAKGHDKFEKLSRETEVKYEKIYDNLRKELITKHQVELMEVEERKNRQHGTLVADHNIAYSDLKNYYNDIALNNLALIGTLRDTIDLTLAENEKMAQVLEVLPLENKKLVEPLRVITRQANQLERQIVAYERDMRNLAYIKNKSEQSIKRYEEFKSQNSALERRCDKLEEERDQLRTKIKDGAVEVQQKLSVKNAHLQRKMYHLQQLIKRKDTAIREITATANIQSDQVHGELENLLKSKNSTISHLRTELARISKAHDDLLRTYEAKLTEYKVPIRELGFKPLKIKPHGQIGVTLGPAGLVAKYPW